MSPEYGVIAWDGPGFADPVSHAQAPVMWSFYGTTAAGQEAQDDPPGMDSGDDTARSSGPQDDPEGTSQGHDTQREHRDTPSGEPVPDPCTLPFDPPVISNLNRADPECAAVIERYDERIGSCDAPRVNCPRDECEYTGRVLSYWTETGSGAYREQVCEPPPCDAPDTSASPRSLMVTGELHVSYDPIFHTLSAWREDVSASEVEFIQAAWNFLQDNDDIIEWLECLLAPNRYEQGCLYHTLNFGIDGDPVEISITTVAPLWHPGDFYTSFPDRVIHIHRYRDNWQQFYAMWSDASTDDEAMCAVAMLASEILHELFHTCLGWAETFDLPSNCDLTYMMSRSFQWAIAQRYTCLSDEAWCRYPAEEPSVYWMSDAGWYTAAVEAEALMQRT